MTPRDVVRQGAEENAGDATHSRSPVEHRSRPTGDSPWAEGYERLLVDPAFGPLVKRVGPVRLQHKAPDTFGFLVRAITYQQVAGKAAKTIHNRVVAALGGTVTPIGVRKASEESLRAAGLSGSKRASIRELAERVANGSLVLGDLRDLPDREIVDRLVQVRGIGRWTAEMLLILHLRRPDVWPVGDLGVRNGAARIFGWREAPSPREMELIGLGYRPWRSATAWYCWRAVETATPR